MAAGTSNLIAQFTPATTAAVRFTINTNADGNIATENDAITGSKTMNFTYTKATATAQEIIYGSTTDSATVTTSGIATTFIEYLLGGSIITNATRRTLLQNSETTIDTQPTPEDPDTPSPDVPSPDDPIDPA